MTGESTKIEETRQFQESSKREESGGTIETVKNGQSDENREGKTYTK